MRAISFEDARNDLQDFLQGISSYLDQVVLCGGWVPYFYRRLPELTDAPFDPLLTYDYDFTIPRELKPIAQGSLREMILRAGFLEIRGVDPPVAIYQKDRWGGREKAPVHAELLTPLSGSGQDRSGRRKILIEVQEGLFAQQLRYVDLLLHHPLKLDLARIPELEGLDSMVLQIPNPGAYLLQKALIHRSRRRSSRVKDLAYMFEVGYLWREHVDLVNAQLEEIGDHSREWRRWVDSGARILASLFAEANSDGPISAEQVYRDQGEESIVDREGVYRVMSEFLQGARIAGFGG